ncbi:MAG: FAD-linked oxidase C-terminal domain-containing protein [Pseudomonadales bacterium]|nr:FAD-linked oxidase C-terminal domain-containing protein [Pseudomonadales bacterium]
MGDNEGNLKNTLNSWCKIKDAANELIVGLGGTITHHHAVGRDHKSGYEQQTSSLFRETLSTAKHNLDPKGILNPGVLVDPLGVSIGLRGVLRDNQG